MSSLLFDLFYENVKKMPYKKAICCDNDSISYEDLSILVLKYANMLQKNGVEYEDHIGIIMSNSIESVAIIFVAALLGVCLVPINPTIPINVVEGIFSVGRVKHIIARKSFFKKMENSDILEKMAVRICLDGEYDGTISYSDIKNCKAEIPQTNKISGDELLFLTMTSGSTGSPKPIALSQMDKYKRAFAHVRLYDIDKDDIILAATPLYHSLAERLVILPLLIGATSVILPRFTPKLWLKCVDKNNVTFTIAVSSQLSQVARIIKGSCDYDIGSLRCVVSSSALLAPEIRSEIIKTFECDFHEMYGTSETSTITSINFREVENKQNSVGRCIEGANIKIVDDIDREVKIGEVGEIICKTRLVFSGYYNKIELTENAFSNGYFKTGDIGKIDKDGYLYFCGRKKDIIITGGINVYPQDIEEVVGNIEAVRECAVFPYPDERLGEIVALAIVGENVDVRDIRVFCARNLADFQQPHKIFVIKELPKNTMGKLMRGKIINIVKDSDKNE